MMRTRVIGSQWLPRCMVIPLVGLLFNLLMAVCLILYFVEFLPSSHGATPEELSGQRAGIGEPPDLSTLNVRLSTRPVHPPDALVKRTVMLPGLRGARPLYGEPTRAAILEDDARRRVLILSADGRAGASGPLRAHLLHDFDLERYLPGVTACARVRRCAFDRTPATGGLACVAMCLVEALRS